MKTIFVAGIGLAVFIELLLISKKWKSRSDKILTLWMFLVLAHLFLFYIHFARDIFNFPILLGIGLPFPLLHGVFLYLYVASLTNQLPENRKILFLHFLPAGVMYVYLFAFYVLPADLKLETFRNQGTEYEVFNIIRWYAIVLSGVFYIIWSTLLLRKHRRNIRDQFSDLEKINLRWLQIITIALGGIWLLVIFTDNDALIYTGVVVFVFLIGFFGIRQVNIFTHGTPPVDHNEKKEKYRKSGLSENVSQELHQRLLSLMTETALYRKSNLSIDDLATKLGVHPNYLSQVINQKEKKNFYDFVNSYRIEEFKRLIMLPENHNVKILAIAYDCGYNSKSSFNRCFKKAVGKTPSQYVATIIENRINP
jgi:AraC-like DNA-binding protein